MANPRIIPKDDDFAQGSTVYGDKLAGYIACQMFSGETIGTSSYTIGTQPLHDGHQIGGGLRAAAVAHSSLGNQQAGVLYRGYSSTADVVVRATQRAIVTSGAITNKNLLIRFQGVCARVSGGAEVDGVLPLNLNNPQRIVDVQEGYFFVLLSRSSGATWYLLKITGGTFSTLASKAFAGNGDLTDEIDPLLSFRMTLDVEDDGADTDLVCSVTQANGAIPAALKGPGATLYLLSTAGAGTGTENVITHTDNSSPVQTEGRVGFISTAAHSAGLTGGTPNVATVVEEFELQVAAVTVFRDTFNTFDRGLAFLHPQGTPGFPDTSNPRDLRCGWAGDFFSKTGTAGELVRGTGTFLGEVGLSDNGATETTEGFYLSQRKATDVVSQYRELSAFFGTTQFDGSAGTAYSGEFRQIGVGVRTTRLVTGTPLDGYEIDLRPDEASLVAWVKLRRWSGGVATTIASKLSGLTVNPGTAYTLAARCFNLPDAQGLANGIVVIEAYFAGVQVVLTAETTPLAGVVVDTSGTVYDTSTARTTEGDGEFFRITCPAGNNLATTIDTWQENSLETTPGTPEGDQLSITVETETTNYTATELTVEFDIRVSETRLDRMSSVQYETGHVRKSRLDLSARRMFEVRALNTTEAERDTLEAFYDARNGIEEAFDWTPPLEGATIKVCFVDDKLGTALKAPGVFSFSFKLQEVF